MATYLGLSWTDVDWERGTLRVGRRVIRLLAGTPFVKQTAKSGAGLRTIKLSPGTLDTLRSFQTDWKRKQLSGSPRPLRTRPAARWNKFRAEPHEVLPGRRTMLGGDPASELPIQMATYLAAVEWQNPEELIFVTKSGQPLNPTHVKVSLERLIKAAGVPRITPHELRKTSITLALAGGANPKAVSQRVGHKDVGLTLRVYSAVTTAMEDEVVGILSAALSDPFPERSNCPA